MAKVELLQCLIISPSDVPEAREGVRSAIEFWNAQVGRGREVRIEAVMWESHSRPEVGDHPQAIINRQFVDDCHMGVGVFWTRLGSPTKDFASGSVEEIDRLVKKGATVMVYFSDEPVSPSALSVEQLTKLAEFREGIQKKALWGTFKTQDELQRLVMGHLTSLVEKLLKKVPLDNVTSAPLPDVRIQISAGAIIPEPSDKYLKSILSVVIENHSSVDFFFGGTILFVLSNGNVAQPSRDAVTGEWITPKVVKSGDSISYKFSAKALLESAAESGAQIVCAQITDKISRKYRSEPSQTDLAIENARMILKS